MAGIPTLDLELLGPVPIYFGFGVQCISALILGGLVGYDREKKLKSAGLKTHMLICLGSTVFTSVGLAVALLYGDEGDPNRIAAQIVSGVGFLGGGAIIRGQGNVIGLTSAATIWLVAAIGFTIGAGFPLAACGFTLTVLIVLNMINPVYKLLEKPQDREYFQLEILTKGTAKKSLLGVILSFGVKVDEYHEEEFEVNKNRNLSTIYLYTHLRTIERIASSLRELLKVEEVSYHPVAMDINRQIKAYEFLKKPDPDIKSVK